MEAIVSTNELMKLYLCPRGQKKGVKETFRWFSRSRTYFILSPFLIIQYTREVQVLRWNNSSTSKSMYQPTEQKRHKLVDTPKILLINDVVISKHSRASPGSILMMIMLTRLAHAEAMLFLFNFFPIETKNKI